MPPPADVPPQRMAVYRRLVYNNIESLLAGFFPVTRNILADWQWHGLVGHFLAAHRSHNPYFMELSGEFLAFLETGRGAHPEDPPFLRELVHYEGVELALLIAEERFTGSREAREALPHGRPILSPLTRLLSYRFPVHLISPDHQPRQAPQQPTTLVAYRNTADEVRFLAINSLTYRLLQMIGGNDDNTSEALLAALHREFSPIDAEVFARGGLDTLENLQRLDVIGFRF